MHIEKIRKPLFTTNLGRVGGIAAMICLAACGDIFSGTDALAPGGGQAGGVQQGVVKGIAVDSQGRPVAGAHVVIDSTVYAYSALQGRTGPDGRYSMELTPSNSWSASATITKSFNGREYCLRLHPEITDSFVSRDGAIRNFDWRLRGLIPELAQAPRGYSSYYGAALAVAPGDFYHQPQMNYVQVTLIPQGQLVDGTAGQPITASPGNWEESTIGDIPLGRYSVRADYAPPGASRVALRLATSMGGTYSTSIVVDFDPTYGGCLNPKATIYVRG